MRGSILVVEDDEHIREALADVLRHESFDVATATDGENALKALAGSRPSVILLDLMMPRMDGETFLLQRANIPELKDIPVIVLSASPPGSLAGAAEVLRKPVDIHELMGTIGRHLGA